MEQLLPFISQSSVITFMLLFVRFSSLFMFMPFFAHTNIPGSVKAVFGLYCALLFYPIVPVATVPFDTSSLILAVLSEATFGFISGFFVSTLFGAVGFAGEQIGITMSFSMASTYDPQNQQSSQVISVLLTFFTLLVLLAFNGHHLIIRYIEYSLQKVPLGTFGLSKSYMLYAMEAVKNIFLIGFTIAFPLMAMSLLSDIIFGMIMKTMPSFNLLVVGLPVKIILGMAVLMATLSSTALIFQTRFSEIINHLLLLL